MIAAGPGGSGERVEPRVRAELQRIPVSRKGKMTLSVIPPPGEKIASGQTELKLGVRVVEGRPLLIAGNRLKRIARGFKGDPLAIKPFPFLQLRIRQITAMQRPKRWAVAQVDADRRDDHVSPRLPSVPADPFEVVAEIAIDVLPLRIV